MDWVCVGTLGASVAVASLVAATDVLAAIGSTIDSADDSADGIAGGAVGGLICFGLPGKGGSAAGV